jgi:GTP cyclohydrolase IA
MAKQRTTSSPARVRPSDALLKPARVKPATNVTSRVPLTADERTRFEGHMGEIFSRLGMDLDSPGTRDTPRRHIQALWDLTLGYDGDPKVGTVFPRECRQCPEGEFEQTVEGPISFTSLCEHHALPFHGNAWVGYLRNEQIIGISKLTRIVHLYTRRFSLQERIAQEIVNALITLTDPFGAAVYLEAKHSCTRARGVYEVNAKTRTFLARGAYSQHPRLIDEFMVVSGLHRPLSP